MTQRRIAFFSEHASPVALRGSVDAGGQNVYVDEVSRNLARLGYAVDIFTRRDDPQLPEIIAWANNVRIINLTAGPAQYLFKDELWPLMPAFRDAFLAFMQRENVRYDLLHGNFWMSGWVATQLRQLLGIPAVQIFHATGRTKRRHQGDADTSPDVRIMVEEAVIAGVDRIIAQCPEEARELIEDYGAKPAKVVIIPSAVNTAIYHPVAKDAARRYLAEHDTIHLGTHELVVAYIGRMLPRKDPRNIVRALALLAADAALPPVRLLLVGGETVAPDPATTPEIGELQRLAAELGVADRLIFTGKRQPEVLCQYYSAADVAVTTPWYEPFGLTPLEGQACGRPVIGSAVGGITFTIADGKTGLLVPPRDPVALAHALAQLLTKRDLRARLGHAARERVERDFTWPTVANRTAALYATLLAGDMPPGPMPLEVVAAHDSEGAEHGPH